MNREEIAYKIMYGVSCNDFKPLAEVLHDGSKGMYVILRFLDKSTSEITAGDISNSLNISTARVAVVLKVLEKKNYIIKYKSSIDARKTIVEITDEGKEALKKRTERIANVIKMFLGKLTEEEINQLLNIINKVLNKTI